MKKPDLLLHTKFRLSAFRPSLVPRPRLEEQILQGLQGPLTLVVAPAGFGKTTLVASCLAGYGLPVAWLSLDEYDNQAGRFLRYVVAALREVDDTLGGDVEQFMAGMQPLSLESILTSLINDLDAASTGIVLVLDDYQFINSPTVHDEVAFLLDHCPNTFHIAIITRSDPPLPLARLRARGQLVELRAADLGFTRPEAAQFLNDIMGLHLDAASVAVIDERTEGWIAGLQMAALSMRGRKDVDGFVRAFAGTNRFIMDFMLEEVLDREPEEVQDFLLRTAVLTRLTRSLCDAVTGTSGSQGMLRQLERCNLFVIPLDDTCCWYRYHQLFADLLRARLDELYPGLSPRLHGRAAAWYEANGFEEDAIHHALAAGDYPDAARLVETVAEHAWLNGQYASILAWTKAIPEDLMHSRPWLCIWNAWANTQMGVLPAIDQWSMAAEQSMEKQYGDISSIASPAADMDAQALMNEIAALKAFAVSFSKNYAPAIKLAESVLKNPPLKNKKVTQFSRCNLLHLLSSMYYATGDLYKAEQTCQETIELAHGMGFTLRHLHSVNKLILINNVNGHLYRSYQLTEETLSLLQQQSFNNYFAALQLHCRRIELFYEWNQFEEFQHLVEFVLEQIKMVDVPYLLVDACNIQALELLLKNDCAGSQDALNRARALARQTYTWEGLTWRTESLQVRLWLKRGDLSPAIAWAAQQTAGLDDIHPFSTESRAISQARILLAQGAFQGAISLLARLFSSAEAEGRRGSLIEIGILKAIAFMYLDEWGQAVAEVESVLALAEREGYVRTFLDEGPPMAVLLSHVANDTRSPHAKYALRLLEAFREETGSAMPNIHSMASHDNEAPPLPNETHALLVETLSQRELEVIRLMALGKTNQEIARELIIAPGTVKAHTASIYRKLDAANRTEAAARARQLGILY